jgi:hypothetical protein
MTAQAFVGISHDKQINLRLQTILPAGQSEAWWSEHTHPFVPTPRTTGTVLVLIA